MYSIALAVASCASVSNLSPSSTSLAPPLALLVLGQSQPPSLFFLLSMSVLQDASAGNRTRVTSMATMYSTTRPLMLLLCAADACLLGHACLEYPSLALLPPIACPSVLQLRPPHLLLRAPASLLLLHAAFCTHARRCLVARTRVERLSCFCFKESTPVGFEPTRGDPIGLPSIIRTGRTKRKDQGYVPGSGPCWQSISLGSASGEKVRQKKQN